MAARNLGSLTIDLIAKTAGFERGMDRAARTADSRMRQIERRAKIVGAAIGTAVAGAGIALAAIVRSNVRNMAEVARMADQIGIATEHLTAMRYAAEQLAGVSSGQFDMALRRMTRRITEAADGGGPAAKAIEAMGLSARELARMSPDEQFRKIADAIKATGDQGTRLRHVMALMDTEGMPLVTMLAQGSAEISRFEQEAAQLGKTFDDQAGQGAIRFEQNLDRLKGTVSGIWTQVSARLVPTLEDSASRLADVAKQGDLAANAVSILEVAIRGSIGTIDLYNESVRRTSIFMQLAVESGEGFREIGKNLVAFWSDGTVAGGMEKVRKAWADAEEQFNRTGEAAGGVNVVLAGIDPEPVGLFRPPRITPPDDPGTGGGGSSRVSDANRELQELLREQQRLADAQRGWTDQLLDAQASLAGPIAEAYRQHDKQLASLTQAYDKGEVELSDYIQMQEVYEEQLNRTLEAIAAQRTPAQRMLEDLQFEQDLLRMTNEEREVAIALRWLNAEATDAERDAIANSVRELRQSREAMSDLIEAQDAVRGAGADFLTDWTTGAKSFKDAMIDALDSIHQRLTQMIAEQLMDQLFGQRGQDGGGQYGNWLSNIFGAMFGGGKASGGWASSNRIFEVNERGLEMATVGGRDYMLTGNQPVRVTPNHQLGGGPVVLNMNNNYAAPQSNKTVTQVAARTSYELARARRLGQ